MAPTLSPFDYALWVSSTLFQWALFYLLVTNRLYRRLPFFSTYILLVLLGDATVWWTYHSHGYASLASFWLSWTLQALTLGARGLVVGELCYRVLRPYRGVWALAWRLLTGVGIALVVFAGLSSYSSRDRLMSFILTAERGLELAAAILLVLLLLISRYYRITIPRPELLLIVSLCVWSLAQGVNDLVLVVRGNTFFEVWKKIRMTSYLAALSGWVSAARRPVAAELPQPSMDAAQYKRVGALVNVKLDELNNRLLEIFKA